MKIILGVILILAGVAVGLYVGVWLCFIGGIIQIVDAIKTTPTEGFEIAIGILRVVFAGVAGVLSAFIAIFPGWAMLNS